jgi:hypothetical protein
VRADGLNEELRQWHRALATSLWWSFDQAVAANLCQGGAHDRARRFEVEVPHAKASDLAGTKARTSGETDQQAKLKVLGSPPWSSALATTPGDRISDGLGQGLDLAVVQEVHLFASAARDLEPGSWVHGRGPMPLLILSDLGHVRSDGQYIHRLPPRPAVELFELCTCQWPVLAWRCGTSR